MGADMALVFWLLVALVPCLVGMGALRILYGSQTTQEMSLADCILTGGMICIGLAETAHLGAVMLGWSFSRCVNVFVVAVIGMTVAAVVVLLVDRALRKRQRQEADGAAEHKLRGQKLFAEVKPLELADNKDKGTVLTALRMCFALMLVMQFVYVYTRQGVYIDGDITLETVNSFVESDALYRINPVTGREYTLGIPMRLKILCLPTLYGALSSVFGLNTEMVVYGMVPALVLMGCYLAYSTVGKYLFPADALKRAIFMIFVALLIGVGDYMYGMEGFGVLHSGFRGVTMRGAVLLPYVFGLLLRRKYRLVLLCIFAEACMVWTLYGMGACVLIAVGMIALDMGMSLYAKQKGREGADICRNS